MPSPIDICNMALSEIGTRSTIAAFDEGSAESEQCSVWYDSLREMLLRAAPWGFSRAQANLALLGTLGENTSPNPWPYKYLYPADALRVRYMLPPQPNNSGLIPNDALLSYCGPSRANRFIIGNDLDEFSNQRKVVLTNVKDTQAVYIIDVQDVSLFDASFRIALVGLLAFKLVIPLTGNAGMRRDFALSAQDAINSARAADGNEAISSTDHTPDWISARGGDSGNPYADPLWGQLGSWFVGWDNISWGS